MKRIMIYALILILGVLLNPVVGNAAFTYTTVPIANETGVDPSISYISIRFSTFLSCPGYGPFTVVDSLNNPVAGTVTPVETSVSLIGYDFFPSSSLDQFTIYTATLNLAGCVEYFTGVPVPYDSVSWSFTTWSPPVAVTDGDLNASDGVVTLDASQSYDLDGNIISFKWDLKARENESYTRVEQGEVVDLVDLRPFTYDVVLTVTDNSGLTATDQFVIYSTISYSFLTGEQYADADGDGDIDGDDLQKFAEVYGKNLWFLDADGDGCGDPSKVFYLAGQPQHAWLFVSQGGDPDDNYPGTCSGSVGSTYPAPVPQSGQTICYSKGGNVIPCAGTGQDGELRRGIALPIPRFTDNNNGTVTDNLTGLIWLKNMDCFGAIEWPTVLSEVANLNSGECGLTDDSVAGEWRLPQIKELMSLMDYGGEYYFYFPANHLTNTPVGNYPYWSSTSFTANPGAAFVLDLRGTVEILSKTPQPPGTGQYRYYGHVWPVRGGQ